MSGWCPHGQARKACSVCKQDQPRGRVGELVELMLDQARQNRRWKIDKSKRAFEVALPAAGIAFMFSDKRRIEMSRADLAREVTILLAAADQGLEVTPELLSDETTAAPILTLFRKAREAQAT